MNTCSPNLLAREIASVLSSAFDPNPIQFRPSDEVGVRIVLKACLKRLETNCRLEKALNRNAFLVGCLDFTEDEPVEHLIIGLGYKAGTTTKVESVIHSVGVATGVTASSGIQAVVDRQYKCSHDAEVILFHNHPPNWLNTALDNQPIASDIDRQTLLAGFIQPFALLKLASGGGRLRYYVGENGFVREFQTPLSFLTG